MPQAVRLANNACNGQEPTLALVKTGRLVALAANACRWADRSKMKFTNVRSVYTLNVIVVHSVFGKGVKSDPVREIVQYYTQDGKLLATVDPCEESAQQTVALDASPISAAEK